MQRFWVGLYNVVVVPILWVGFLIGATFKRKIRHGIRGRRNLFFSLRLQLSALTSPPYPGRAGGRPASQPRNPTHSKVRIWFHSSSLGEFEQAKPIIAELKRRHPEVVIMLSFFSPSGYDHSRNYKLADIITYIPFDSYRNAHTFVETLQPTIAVMVRYDVWPNHVWALKKAGIPAFLANATMSMRSSRHLLVANSFHRSVYNALDYILTVSEQDVAAFERFHLTSPVLAAIGDTRFDQVWQRSAESKTHHVLPPELIRNRKIIVVGSSWDSDEEVVIPVFARLAAEHEELLIVLVPHEPTVENLERIERELNGKLTSIRFSDLHDYNRQSVIIIDSIGILMALYQYADIAYVGGSFTHGVHSVLEPAVYGIPVLFGPQHTNSQEAVELVREGAAFTVHNDQELYVHLSTLLSDAALRSRSGAMAKALVEQNKGATERFLSYLEKVL